MWRRKCQEGCFGCDGDLRGMCDCVILRREAMLMLDEVRKKGEESVEETSVFI